MFLLPFIIYVVTTIIELFIGCYKWPCYFGEFATVANVTVGYTFVSMSGTGHICAWSECVEVFFRNMLENVICRKKKWFIVSEVHLLL